VSLAQELRVTLVLADYANTDASGKVNLIGGGWQITNIMPNGMTGPQYLLTLIDVPARHLGEEFATGWSLFDEKTGSVVRMPAAPPGQVVPPGPSGLGAPTQALRVQQLVKAEKPSIPNLHLPPDFQGRIQTILAFPEGLPLSPNGQFSWRLEVDGTHLKHWRVTFITAGPPPPPVIG
jgi:hypothetical protein